MTSPAAGSGAESDGSEGRDEAFPAFLNTEYAHLAESLLRNEEDGEKRVTFFLTLTSGIIAVVGFLVRPTDGGIDLHTVGQSRGFIGLVLLIPLLIGWFTFQRIVKRNVTTDEYKLALRALRRRMVSPQVADTLANAFFGLYKPYEQRTFWLLPLGAGWLEIVALVNVVLASSIAAMALWPKLTAQSWADRSMGIGGLLVVAALGWAFQVRSVRQAYRSDDMMAALALDETQRLALGGTPRH
jgi:hypothetical protein